MPPKQAAVGQAAAGVAPLTLAQLTDLCLAQVNRIDELEARIAVIGGHIGALQPARPLPRAVNHKDDGKWTWVALGNFLQALGVAG
jgi:hypothetical protein